MKKQAAQHTETTTLSDDVLAQVTGGAVGPVLGPPQGPIFPGVTFDYPKRPIDITKIR